MSRKWKRNADEFRKKDETHFKKRDNCNDINSDIKKINLCNDAGNTVSDNDKPLDWSNRNKRSNLWYLTARTLKISSTWRAIWS